jgi:hypothetical protein
MVCGLRCGCDCERVVAVMSEEGDVRGDAPAFIYRSLSLGSSMPCYMSTEYGSIESQTAIDWEI